ncbi:MAG: type II toxin-antitoxin system RelE/ParE family toxin [Nitrospira sp.]|nr:type II toxin-antitoxin system RelE/ParE family toxin [Nitrospira sp.]
MEVEFSDENLDRLEIGEFGDCGYSPGIVKAFRKRMQLIRTAPDERDFYTAKSLHYEKLQGDRSHQHSMRLNKQERLIVEYKGEGTSKIVIIVGIEDYH